MTLRKFLPVLALVITICSCNKSGCQKHYNTATDSIKTQLDTLLGSEGNKIDSLADLGMHKSKDSTDYYYFMLYSKIPIHKKQQALKVHLCFLS